jgi:hypothetical protein
VRAYVVEAENFASIHNHSAFARLVRPIGPQETARPGARRGPHLNLLLTGTSG